MTANEQFLAELSDALFWDVERASVDPEANADFLIVRIMERGTREDVRTAWTYYGQEKVRDCLLSAPALSRKTIAFFANQFGLSRDAFRAHNRAHYWSR
jgi:hypothetical protein